MVGGISTLLHGLVRHSTGLLARVVTFDARTAGEFDRAQPFEVVRIPRGRSHRGAISRLNVKGLAESVRWRPDAFLSGHILMSPATSLARRLIRSPSVQYLYGNELVHRPGLAVAAVRRASASVGISEYTCSLLPEAMRSGVRIIPPGIDLEHTEGARRARRPTIVTISRLDAAYKGHDVTARALALVRDDVPDFEWVVIGDGPLRRHLEGLVSSLGIEQHVRFEGGLSDEDRDCWLDRAHVFCMPSRVPAGGAGEGFGIVYLEAAAHGVPAIAGRVGGAVDAVVPGQTGLLVDAADHVAVATALTSLLKDPARAEVMGRAAAERAEDFRWPLVASRFEALVTELIEQRVSK
jgi:phosphatidyl-myo-inositol dimannoside synthase